MADRISTLEIEAAQINAFRNAPGKVNTIQPRHLNVLPELYTLLFGSG